MKYLSFTLLIFLALACNKQDPDETEEAEKEVTQSVCESDAFHFSIEVNGISLTADSCWLVYHEDPADVLTNNDYPAIIKWEYPGYPEWNGANSFTFNYDKSTIESGQSYQTSQILGVLEFDGSNGEMFQGLGENTVTVDIAEYNDESNFICGTFAGQALFTDYSVVDLTGSFKGYLKPQ